MWWYWYDEVIILSVLEFIDSENNLFAFMFSGTILNEITVRYNLRLPFRTCFIETRPLPPKKKKKERILKKIRHEISNALLKVKTENPARGQGGSTCSGNGIVEVSVLVKKRINWRQ